MRYDNVLLSGFYDLYSIIIELKDKIQGDDWFAVLRFESELFVSRLLTTSNRINQELNNSYIADKFMYAIAALYDKIILSVTMNRLSNHDDTVNKWESCSLEAKLFKTAKAGQRLFDDINEVDNYKYTDFSYPMLKVYLNIVNIAFIGTRQQEEINKLKNNLVKKIYSLNKLELPDENSVPKFISAKLHSKPKNDYFGWICSALVSLYLFSSSVVWLNATSPVLDRVNVLLKQV